FNTVAPNDWFRRLNGSFAHLWHPDIVVLDSRLTEVRRFIGYLTPRDFIAQLTIGAGLAALYHMEAPRALALFERVVDEYSASGAAAEALYWAGVAAYRAGGGIEALTSRWEAIHARYPTSEWSIRADCLDLNIPESGFLDTDLSTVRFTQPSTAC
ncbi:MAG: tetratricopeptide repeat protein, partial [Vicinamibacterales bacterium]